MLHPYLRVFQKAMINDNLLFFKESILINVTLKLDLSVFFKHNRIIILFMFIRKFICDTSLFFIFYKRLYLIKKVSDYIVHPYNLSAR